MQLNKTKEKSIEDIKKELELKKISHPFDDDLLGLKPFAETISNIVVSTKDPFVFSINSPYGTGKTFFLRRLHCLLEQKGCMCVSYNAWESDFYDNPLPAIISALERQTLTQKIIDTSKQTIKNISKTSLNPLKKVIEEISILFEKKEKIYDDFKKYQEAKEKFIKDLTNFVKNKKLVFIIDELDRCRPDYAIKTLETIKHFFNIPNIVFIIGVDRKQIESTVKVLYGSNVDNNCDEYLRKFIDQDFYLPKPSTEMYIKSLCTKYLTEILYPYAYDNGHTFSVLNFEIFYSPNAIFYSKQKQIDVMYILNVFTVNLMALAIYFNFSLRKIEELIILIKIFISALNPKDNYLFPELICYLLSIRIFEHSYLEEKNCLNIFDSQYTSVIDKKYAKLQNIELVEPSHKSTFFNLQNSLKERYKCKPVDLWQEILCGANITKKAEEIENFVEIYNIRIKTNVDTYFNLAKQLIILTTENK